MTDLWLVNDDGHYALATTDAEREQFLPLGWQAAVDAPPDDAQVWVINENTGGRGRLPAGSLGTWSALGWRPSTPPFDGPSPPEPIPAPPVAPAPEPTSRTKPATGGETKE